MSEIGQIFIALLIVAGGYVLSIVGVTWMTRRTARRIMADIERRGARDEATAVTFPIEQKSLLQFGLRDNRPRALEALLHENLIVRTEDNRYYLTPAARRMLVDDSVAGAAGRANSS